MAAEDFRDPFSLSRPETSFLKMAQTRKKPLKVAFSQDLGITPVDAEIAEICKRAALKFEEMGVVVEEECPDLSGVHESYQTLRAKDFAVSLGDLYRAQPSKLKPEIIGNIEQGLNLSLDEIAKAELKRGQLRNRAVNFFDDYDLLLCPTSIVAPYPVDNRYVSSCSGVNFDNYIDWLAIVYAITLVSLPALSLPCGFTKSGLPVGLQMITRPRGDAELLSYALQLEESLSLDLKPIDPIKKG
jgi:amidase